MKQWSMSEFSYDLPASRIALSPCEPRDQAKLLVYRSGNISHSRYAALPELLPSPSSILFNNTRVIPARMRFTLGTGSIIEVFLLEPYAGDYQLLHRGSPVRWKAMIGGLKKWSAGQPLSQTMAWNQSTVSVSIVLVEKKEDYCVVDMQWDGTATCRELIECIGNVPLPPYIKREAEEQDKLHYQTVYAEQDGSVAAPTAGLHFTPHLLETLSEKGIAQRYLTLHVGAGTFKPVTAASIADHQMHHEYFEVDRSLLLSLAHHEDMHIAVGTTTLRTLESLYWMAVKAMINPQSVHTQWELNQWEHIALNHYATYSRQEAFMLLSERLAAMGHEKLSGRTGICITPGYAFKTVDALITNFHQPHSTLLLLIAAILGDDWKRVYQEAMDNDYRFLSYGDGSLLFIRP